MCLVHAISDVIFYEVVKKKVILLEYFIKELSFYLIIDNILSFTMFKRVNDTLRAKHYYDSTQHKEKFHKPTKSVFVWFGYANYR